VADDGLQRVRLRRSLRGRGEGLSASPDLDQLFRRESGRAVATLIRLLGDFDLAEEAVQEAFVVAMERWPSDGTPDNPSAWILTTARNRAIDRLRRNKRLAEKQRLLARDLEEAEEPVEMDDFPDDRLRLIFTCCHPSLAPEARVALTLRSLGGLTTAEVARAFLVPEPTMAQRVVRAKRKIRDAGIPYVVPEAHELPDRLGSVLAVLYLVFNEGYSTSSGDSLVRRDLCAEAIRLGGVLAALMPDEAEVLGLVALMMLQDSRRDARVEPGGTMVLLEDQDRARWDRSQIAAGLALCERAVALAPAGRYAIQAAIAAEHARAARAPDTDWTRIAGLYGLLEGILATPVVRLNRAAAIAMAEGPEQGLALMDEVAAELDGYFPLHTARGDLLRRSGRSGDSASAYRRALELATNEVERAFVERRLEELSG
jgi:RNA polymerase sigma-70 factor (ECF subfamily)